MTNKMTNGRSIVLIVNDDMLVHTDVSVPHYRKMTYARALRENKWIINCSCGEPAKHLDSLFPYHWDFNYCEKCYKESLKPKKQDAQRLMNFDDMIAMQKENKILRENQIKGHCDMCKYLRVDSTVIEYYCGYHCGRDWVDYSHYCSRWEKKK